MKGVEEDARIAARREISDRVPSVITPSAVLHDMIDVFTMNPRVLGFS
jgi:hypothetical protein